MFDVNELTNWQEYSKILIGVFALVSPPIIIPLFIGIVSGRSLDDKKKTALFGALGFAITMWVFIFFGGAILDVFGITLGAFRLAGGFLVLLIGLDMMRSDPTANAGGSEASAKNSALALGIVPIAIPILAGPGAVSTVVIMSNIHDTVEHRILVAAVILTLAIYVLITLRITAATEKLIGQNATTIFNKVMGLIICAIAFEFIMDGIAEHFPWLITIHAG